MRAILPASKFKNYMRSIVDVVVDDKNLATMLKGMKASGLEDELCKPGPFTVFAPSEMAFGKMPQGELTELMRPENKDQLSTLLSRHVVEGKNNLSDFKDGQKLKTLGGKELLVRVVNGSVMISGSVIQGHDNDASNGTVHSLDKVIR